MSELTVTCNTCDATISIDVIEAHASMHANVAKEAAATTERERAVDRDEATKPAQPTSKRSKAEDHQFFNPKAKKWVRVRCGSITGENDGEIKARRKRQAKKLGVDATHELVIHGAHPKRDNDGLIVKGTEPHATWKERGGMTAHADKWGSPEAHSLSNAQPEVIADGMGAEGQPAFDAELAALKPFVDAITTPSFERLVSVVNSLISDVQRIKAQSEMLDSFGTITARLDAIEESLTAPDSPVGEIVADEVPERVATLNAAAKGVATPSAPLANLAEYVA